MNESTSGEYFCDNYLCICLDKDVPYCIIVFFFFLCVCGVYTYQLPLFILEDEMYRNVNGNLRISLDENQMQTNKAIGDYIDLMNKVLSAFSMG